MNDQFPPPSWSLRPEHWMYRLPGTVFGRLPASWAPQLPPARTSDTWDQRAPTESSPDTPSRGGILGQFSQPIDPPPVDPWSQLSGPTGWNSLPANNWDRSSPSLQYTPVGTDTEYTGPSDLPTNQWRDGTQPDLGKAEAASDYSGTIGAGSGRSGNMSHCLPLYVRCQSLHGGNMLINGKRCQDCFNMCTLNGEWPFHYCPLRPF
jgi:hypothetical protein